MLGFFRPEQVSGPGVVSERASCATCGLYKSVLSPRMAPYGEFRQRIMVIGEAPGETEDRRGKPWQGKTGEALYNKLRKLGIDLFKDCVSINAVMCRPTDPDGNNRSPTGREILSCRPRVLDAIREYRPRLILLLGGAAVESVIGSRWQKDLGGITRWRGYTIPDHLFGAWLCPTFHPSFVERQRAVTAEVDVIWEEDLRRALAKLDEPLPAPVSEELVTVTDDVSGVLDEVTRPGLLALDIETNSLRPYGEGKRIVCMSFCHSEDRAYAIPAPTTEADMKRLRRLLRHPRIGKIAANMKFEDTWLKVCYGIAVRPWAFDTVLAAHILDNRPGITGLKFQAYVNFGVVGYDEEVSRYLHSAPIVDGEDSLNKVETLLNTPAFRRVMVYNGLDSLLTYRLALKQMEEMGYVCEYC